MAKKKTEVVASAFSWHCIPLIHSLSYSLWAVVVFPIPWVFHVVVKKTVHGRNWSTKACEPILHTHARQEAYKDEVGTSEDQAVGFGW